MAARLIVDEAGENLILLASGRVAVVKISHRRWDIISLIWRAEGAVVSYDAIIRAIWPNPDREPEGAYRAIQVALHFVRAQLDRYGIRDLIASHYGKGLWRNEKALSGATLTKRNSLTAEQLRLFDGAKLQKARPALARFECPHCGTPFRVTA